MIYIDGAKHDSAPRLRRACAVTVFQPAGCIGCRDRSDQATLRLRIEFWKLFFSVQSD
jgi:hypothetical protein